MKLCKVCEGEGVVIEGLPTDDYKTCHVCEGRGVVNIPTSVFLQITNLDSITWSEGRVFDDDIEYRLAPVKEA